LLGALVAIGVITFLTYRSLEQRSRAVIAVNHAHAVQRQIMQLAARLRESEAGQRGFLITGMPEYLEAYERFDVELETEISELRHLLAEPAALGQSEAVQRLLRTRLDLIAESVQRKRAGDDAGALGVVRGDRGRRLAEQATSILSAMSEREEQQLQAQNAAWERSVTWSSYVTFGGAGVLVTMLLIVGLLASRDFRTTEDEGWLRRLQVALGREVQGDLRLESLGAKVLGVVGGSLDAQIG
jgi:methyl-accepting chemotaxis protein